MKIAAVMKEDGCIAKTTAEATQILIVTEEARVPTAKEILDIGGQEITSVVLKLAAQNVDVFLAGEMSTILQSALRMLGISLYPGCEGDAIENIAAYLSGEIVGDPSKIVIPEEDENDPMSCMHDCAKCMSNCATRTEEQPLQ
jgi:predicted Fe-Mo cluster-binding NifX family protein